MMKPLSKYSGRSASGKRRAPNEADQSGIANSPTREKQRSSIMETPLCGVPLNLRRISKVSSDQGMTRSNGSASYGNQIAAAAPEVVRCPIFSAKICVRRPCSANSTAQVKPETPAPTMATRFGMAASSCKMAGHHIKVTGMIRKLLPSLGHALLLCSTQAKAPDSSTHFAKLDDIRVHYTDYGKGDIALVFVHGW